MIDVGQKLRKAYFDLLDGNITYGGKVVPVVDEKLEMNINDTELYVIFTSQNEVNVNTKSNWIREVEMAIRVVNYRQSTNTKEAVENVSSQILNIIFPSKNTNSVSLDSPLKLSMAVLMNSEYNPVVQTENGFFVSKVLVIKNRVIQ